MNPLVRDDLAKCLAFDLPHGEREALRTRLNAGGWQHVLDLADELRLTPALAVAVDAKGLAADIPMLRLPNGRVSVTAQLHDALAEHGNRNAVLLARLHELLEAFEAEGVPAILLKGARALWTGTPQWRTLRDLDLLVPEPNTRRAQQIAVKLGYGTTAAGGVPADWHHDENLYRHDLPGWLEIHGHAAMHRADALLPTHMLVAEAELIDGPPRPARALPMPHHILHCMLHHHVGHRGDKWGTVDLKGLYEFAADVGSLDEESRHDLVITTFRHPRLLAMLDLWLAGAAELFRLDVRAPLAVHADAQKRWHAISSRMTSGRRRGDYDGVAQEALMAMDARRLKRLPGGQGFMGRQRLRLAVVSSLLAPATKRARQEPRP